MSDKPARPDPAVLGLLTARLYALADEANVDRALAEKWVEYLFVSNARFRMCLDTAMFAAVAAAKEKPREVPTDGGRAQRADDPG